MSISSRKGASSSVGSVLGAVGGEGLCCNGLCTLSKSVGDADGCCEI